MELSLERDKDQIMATKMVLDLMAKGYSKSDAMIEADYQLALKNNPEGISETDAWRLVMAKYLPNKVLAQKHRQLLEKVDHTGQPDTQAVGKALEMAYKLQGKFVDRVDVTTQGNALPAQVVFNFQEKRKIVDVDPQ